MTFLPAPPDEGGIAIALSGGVDSSLLAVLARLELGDRMIALTADTPFTPRRDIERARDLAAARGFVHGIVRVDTLSDPAVASNPADRCYHCKRMIMERLLEVARERGHPVLADGTNADDDLSTRPGARALGELGVVSPLRDAGMRRADIVALSREHGLPDPERPNNACLATRVPLGTPIDRDLPGRIDLVEQEIAALGFTLVRFRTDGRNARIELLPEELASASADGRLDALHALPCLERFELAGVGPYIGPRRG